MKAVYTRQKLFSNTCWWNCGSRNYNKTWSTRCTNLTFTYFDTLNVIVFFMILGWGNIHGKVFGDTVHLKDTLIEIKGNFHHIGSPLKLSIDVSSRTFLYEWCHLPYVHVICFQCSRASDSFSIGVYSWNILLGLTPAFIQRFSLKSHTRAIFNWRRVLWTHFDVLLNLVWSHYWLEMTYFGLISRLLR